MGKQIGPFGKIRYVMAKFRPKHNGRAPDSPFFNGGRAKPSPDEVVARKMTPTWSVGKKNAAVRMDSLKPNKSNGGHVNRTDFRRDLAALVALFTELDNKKTRARKPIRHRLHMAHAPRKYRAVLQLRKDSAPNISTISTVASSRPDRNGMIERRITSLI